MTYLWSLLASTSDSFLYLATFQMFDVLFLYTIVRLSVLIKRISTNVKYPTSIVFLVRKTSICRGHFHCSKTTCPSPCARSISRARLQGMVEMLCIYLTVMFWLALALAFGLCCPKLRHVEVYLCFVFFFIPCLFVFFLYSFSNYFVYFPNN